LASDGLALYSVRASATELRWLQERRLDEAEWLVLVLDGKTFAGDQLALAPGVTATGDKPILGLVQTASENKRGTLSRISIPVLRAPLLPAARMHSYRSSRCEVPPVCLGGR
jgi:hypothetical protein